MPSFRHDSKLSLDGPDPLFDNQGSATIFLQLNVIEATAERKAAAIIFNDQGPSPLLARESYQDMLSAAVPAHICQRLAHNSGDLAAGRSR